MSPRASIKTTCPYCGVGCGVLASVGADGAVSVRGDPDHPANFGRLCSKGSALGETMALDDRLLHPEVNGARVGWDAALDLVVARFRAAIDDHGPDSVAFYVSGQLLTEDYYVANKLMKGFIGSANIDTNSRLCMASSVAGHTRAFGADVVPGCYEDLELADLVVLVGSNLAWCHPVLFQRLSAAKERRGTRIVVIDPRRTATCEIADLHLPIAADADVALFNGLLGHLVRQGTADRRYVDSHTTGLDEALSTARDWTVEAVAREARLDAGDVETFFDLFAVTDRAVTVYSQGVNQSSSGTDKVNAILNCHLATGRIGRPGTGPFSVTGQPNAMGGREVGGLANQLACHMRLEDPSHRRLVRRFWGAGRIADRPGLKAVDLFRAVGDGRIKALWIMGTNPVDSLPEADAVRDALAACPFVVVSDVARRTDTTALAHVLLPSAAWGEKDGTVTNSERRISRQKAFLPLPGQAWPDWRQMTEVARRMGFAAAFPYEHPADIFAEYAHLSGFDNAGARAFDISAHADVAREGYDTLTPFQWPRETRFFADGGFFTPDRRARLIATPHRRADTPSPEFPLVLNTGRVRDQWHTMTRTGKSVRLMQHIAEPFVEIHHDDAGRLGLGEAELATVRSASGTIVVRALVTERQRPGTVFVPMHWTDRFASRGRVGALVPGNTDPVSGQPGSKLTPVAVARFEAAWYGFAVARARPRTIDAEYWSLAPTRSGWRIELAGTNDAPNGVDLARALLQPDGGAESDLLAYHDVTSGQHRFACFRDDALLGAVFVGPRPVAVSRNWAAEQLSKTWPTPRERLRLLAGRPAAEEHDRGAIICACFEVGLNQIASAVTAGRCATVDAVGAALSAGTNCGSCRAEIKRLIDDLTIQKAG